MDAEATKTVRVAKVARLGTRRLSRAHLSLSRRPQLRQLGLDGLSRACAALGQRLGVGVTADARLVQASPSLSQHLSAHAAFAVFELASQGELGVLEVELPLLAALAGRLLGSGAPAAAFGLTRLEEAAFGFLCLTVVRALRQSAELEQLCGPRLVCVHADREAALASLEQRWRWLSVEVSLKAAEEEGMARVWLPAQPLQTAVAQIPEQRPAEIPSELLQASVPVRIRAGRTRLELSVAEQLAEGDVVLLDELSLRAGALVGPVRLFFSGSSLRGELVPDGFRPLPAVATAAPLFEEDSMVPEPLPIHPSPLPSLGVDVEVELARVRLSLAELSSLHPGAILPLRCNATQPVTLWIGERAVARAELVEIEGELGAPILHLNP